MGFNIKRMQCDCILIFLPRILHIHTLISTSYHLGSETLSWNMESLKFEGHR